MGLSTLLVTPPPPLSFSDPEVHPQNEEYWGHVNPIGPRACYDEGKRVAETMCYAYMKQVGSPSPYRFNTHLTKTWQFKHG